MNIFMGDILTQKGEELWFESFYSTRFKYLDALNESGLDLNFRHDRTDNPWLDMNMYCKLLSRCMKFRKHLETLNRHQDTPPPSGMKLLESDDSPFNIFGVEECFEGKEIMELGYFNLYTRKKLQKLIICAQNDAIRINTRAWKKVENKHPLEQKFLVNKSDLDYVAGLINIVIMLKIQLDETIIAIMEHNGFTENDSVFFEEEWL